jgi:hypothetical protein
MDNNGLFHGISAIEFPRANTQNQVCLRSPKPTRYALLTFVGYLTSRVGYANPTTCLAVTRARDSVGRYFHVSLAIETDHDFASVKARHLLNSSVQSTPACFPQ